MKRMTLIALTIALGVLTAGFAFASSHGGHDGHGEMNGKADMHQGMMTMKKNLDMMMQDVEAMVDAAMDSQNMKSMNKHMMDMHKGMMEVQKAAEQSGHAMMQKAMKKVDKHMMSAMKGMGMMKKDRESAIPMMKDSLHKMKGEVQQMQQMMDM
jgi:hypothetical protein